MWQYTDDSSRIESGSQPAHIIHVSLIIFARSDLSLLMLSMSLFVTWAGVSTYISKSTRELPQFS